MKITYHYYKKRPLTNLVMHSISIFLGAMIMITLIAAGFAISELANGNVGGGLFGLVIAAVLGFLTWKGMDTQDDIVSRVLRKETARKMARQEVPVRTEPTCDDRADEMYRKIVLQSKPACTSCGRYASLEGTTFCKNCLEVLVNAGIASQEEKRIFEDAKRTEEWVNSLAKMLEENNKL